MIQNRRRFIKQLTTSTLAAATVPHIYSCSNKEVKITILHTNDVHSHIEPLAADHYKFPNRGGFARRAAIVHKIRKENDHLLLFDSGDIFQGTPYFNFYKGKLEIELMNKMKYDAATIGNHEFDNGAKELAIQVKNARFPFICSNYIFDKTPLEGLTLPYKTFEKGSVKIGVMGLGVELKGLVDPDLYGNTQYTNPVEAANKTARVLKEQEGCDYIVCLSHLGYKYNNDKVSDVVVAKNSSHIDMILGGHSHTFMKQPDKVKNQNNKEVIINQMGWAGVYLGRLDIIFSKYKKQPQILNSIYQM